jgi:hypothetical protein
MGFKRAVIGSIIGFLILSNNGWPIRLIIDALSLKGEFSWAANLIGLGIVIGLIAGSSIWGAVSSFILIIYHFFISRGFFPSLDSILSNIMDFEVLGLILMIVGGFIGGVISGSLSEEDDYLILRLRGT